MCVYVCVCVCKPCICCLISVVGIVATECQTLPCVAPFGRCRLSNVSALAVNQLSCELYECVRERERERERASDRERERIEWICAFYV